MARCAMGLKELGLGKGQTMALIGRSFRGVRDMRIGSPVSRGALPYGIYPTSSPKEVLYLLHRRRGLGVCRPKPRVCGSRIFLTLQTLGHLRHIIVADIKGMFDYDEGNLTSFHALLEKGRQRLDSEPHSFEESVGSPSTGR